MAGELNEAQENALATKVAKASPGSFTRPDLAIPYGTTLRAVPARQQSSTPLR